MPSRAGQLPLLVVDDDLQWRDLTQRFLQKAGIANPVVGVGSVDEAKRFLRACCPASGSRRGRKPAVILLDVKMPEKSGFDVLRWVKRRKAFRKTKVIMWSVSEDDRDRARADELNADAYLVKCANGFLITAAVRACLATAAAEARVAEAADRPPRAGATTQRRR